MLGKTRKIIETLRKAEKHLLAAMSAKDRDERIRLENEAERCIDLARKLELEWEASRSSEPIHFGRKP